MGFRLGDGLVTVNPCYHRDYLMATADFWISLMCLLAGFTVMALTYRMERRPSSTLSPRLIPTTLLMLFGLLLALGAGAHLLSTFGIHPPQS